MEETTYKLVICDVALPDQNGTAVYDAWKKLPHQKGGFVFITGSVHLIDKKLQLDPEVKILIKPFHLKEIYDLAERYITPLDPVHGDIS